MKARPSQEKRRRELKLQERRQEKTERRKLRKDNPLGEGEDVAVAGSTGAADDPASGELRAAPATEE